jgi:lysophospholipase L1-like esterase
VLQRIDRLIVVGDSISEGIADEKINGYYRGWADRVADVIASQNPDFQYANLAIRGKLLPQVVAHQVPAALKLIGPNSVLSFHAGANDVIRPNYNPEITLPAYAKAVRDLANAGAQLMLFTVLEESNRKGRIQTIWRERFSVFNNQVREIGKEVGAVVIDGNYNEAFKDVRYLDKDRLHLNAKGHWLLAQGVLEQLNLPFDSTYKEPLPPMKQKPKVIQGVAFTAWTITFAIPWLIRRALGKSSGDGRSAKYPELISWPRR